MQSLVGEMSWREGRGHIAPAGRKQTEEDWRSAHLFLCNPGFELLSFTPSSPPLATTTPSSLIPVDLAQDHRSWDGATHIQRGSVFPPQLNLPRNTLLDTPTATVCFRDGSKPVKLTVKIDHCNELVL